MFGGARLAIGEFRRLEGRARTIGFVVNRSLKEFLMEIRFTKIEMVYWFCFSYKLPFVKLLFIESIPADCG